MSDIELAVTKSKELERVLESRHRASGKGLHEKVSSIEARLPAPLVGQLRTVATLRNKVVHEDGFNLPDSEQYAATCNAALAELSALPPVSPAAPATGWGRKLYLGWLGICAVIALFVGGFVVYTTGVGAAVAAMFGVMILGILLASDEAIALYKSAGLFILGLLSLLTVISVIQVLWHVGKMAS